MLVGSHLNILVLGLLVKLAVSRGAQQLQLALLECTGLGAIAAALALVVAFSTPLMALATPLILSCPLSTLVIALGGNSQRRLLGLRPPMLLAALGVPILQVFGLLWFLFLVIRLQRWISRQPRLPADWPRSLIALGRQLAAAPANTYLEMGSPGDVSVRASRSG